MSSNSTPLGTESDYLTRRQDQERIAADQSADPSARRAHEQLAEHYAERLRAIPSTGI